VWDYVAEDKVWVVNHYYNVEVTEETTENNDNWIDNYWYSVPNFFSRDESVSGIVEGKEKSTMNRATGRHKGF
jgi:hypothetical protein